MQQPLAWNDAFSVAHPVLDHEHRAIIDAINGIAEMQAGEADNARLRPLLCALKEKVAAHFEHENAMLREIAACTGSLRSSQRFLAAMSEALVLEHLSEHAEALSLLDSMICETLAMSGVPPHVLDERLAHWFVNHAVKHDAHLKTLFQTLEHDCPKLLSEIA